uniref:ATP synthase subunit f, mitochondrial n=1 Tax=Sphenodon punctatus TaxID=8508 RepID=A0A8D0HDI3_SPHPU
MVSAVRRLLDVKLQELPPWLAAWDYSPKGLLRAVHQAWRCYHNKYINMKKGGVAGISMVLAGGCVLGYICSYERLKHSRWRKYH